MFLHICNALQMLKVFQAGSSEWRLPEITSSLQILSRERLWRAQANDLITHLQHSRKQTLSHTLVTNNELRGTKLQTLRFTFITRSSAEL